MIVAVHTSYKSADVIKKLSKNHQALNKYIKLILRNTYSISFQFFFFAFFLEGENIFCTNTVVTDISDKPLGTRIIFSGKKCNRLFYLGVYHTFSCFSVKGRVTMRYLAKKV